MKVTMLLCDAAEVAGGKLYILGGGWSVTGPGPSQMAVAIKIEVPWDQTNRRHRLRLELIDADGNRVSAPAEDPEHPSEVQVEGEFEVGRPPGITPGTPMDFPLAIALGILQLPPGQRFTWKLSID